MSQNTQGSAVINVDSETFEKEILNFEGLALVDFYANWCGPCQRLAPELNMLAEELKDNKLVKIAKLDTQSNLELAQKYQISSIPNVILFKNGQPINQIIGLPQGLNGQAPRTVYKQMLLESMLKN